MKTENLSGCSLVDVLDRLERGKIGYSTAMAWLHIDNLNQLADIMYANGRIMPGHQRMEVAPETRALLRRVTRKLVTT
jgi:hypothetical protein